MKPCTICGRPAVQELPCWRCEGQGELPFKSHPGAAPYPEDCPECEGSGKLGYCEKCLVLKKSDMLRKAVREATTHRVPPERDQRGREAQAHGSPIVAQPSHPWSHRFGGAHRSDDLPPKRGSSPGPEPGCSPAGFFGPSHGPAGQSLASLPITVTPLAQPRLDLNMENTPYWARSTKRHASSKGSYLVLGLERGHPIGVLACLVVAPRRWGSGRGILEQAVQRSKTWSGLRASSGPTKAWSATGRSHPISPSLTRLSPHPLTSPARIVRLTVRHDNSGQAPEEVTTQWTPST
jgi:hypothetical protein